MSTLKERIEYLKINHRITPKALANGLSMDYDAFRMAVKRGNLSDLRYEKIEQIFNVSRTWLSKGIGDVMLTGKALTNAKTSKFNNEAAIRLHKLFKEYLPQEMHELWDQQLAEIIDLCEYKELYLKAKESLLGKKGSIF